MGLSVYRCRAALAVVTTLEIVASHTRDVPRASADLRQPMASGEFFQAINVLSASQQGDGFNRCQGFKPITRVEVLAHLGQAVRIA